MRTRLKECLHRKCVAWTEQSQRVIHNWDWSKPLKDTCQIFTKPVFCPSYAGYIHYRLSVSSSWQHLFVNLPFPVPTLSCPHSFHFQIYIFRDGRIICFILILVCMSPAFFSSYLWWQANAFFSSLLSSFIPSAWSHHFTAAFLAFLSLTK
jgi:hypothetical protein